MNVAFATTLAELRETVVAAEGIARSVELAGGAIINCLRQGGKLLSCGNGGSAADALHLAEELMARYRGNRCALAAVCLNSDVTALTCIANDFGYEATFARQVAALGRPGDVLTGFSTSGNSPNVRAALAEARRLGLVTILLSGRTGGRSCGMADFEIFVPSDNTARIQELHTVVLHHWLEMVECETWASRMESTVSI